MFGASPVPRVTIGGGFAKLVKLAQGLLDECRVRVTIRRQFVAEEAGYSPAHVVVAAAIGGGQCQWCRTPAWSAPQGVEVTSGQLAEAGVGALDLGA